MRCPRAAIFDLDDTLAESFQAPKPEMVARLHSLLELFPVAIMTAAGFPRIERQFLTELASSPHISHFYVFPNSTAECYTHENGEWKVTYRLMLSAEDRAVITKAIEESVAEEHIFTSTPTYEPKIIDRETQIAYAFLGLDAPYEDKAAWDPDKSKRKRLKASLEKKIPQFEILIGGMTTIDITHKGVHKAYGVEWLSKHLNIPAADMLYVGDALYPGGNDEVVIPTGIQTHAVKNPEETLQVIDELLKSCATV